MATPRKVKDETVEDNSDSQALRELFAMLYFLDEHRQWSIKDYMAQPGFPNSALGKLIK